MDCLVLLWIFDKRWLGFKSCLQENTLLVPVAYHLAQLLLLTAESGQHAPVPSGLLWALLLLLIIAETAIVSTVRERVFQVRSTPLSVRPRRSARPTLPESSSFCANSNCWEI